VVVFTAGVTQIPHRAFVVVVFALRHALGIPTGDFNVPTGLDLLFERFRTGPRILVSLASHLGLFDVWFVVLMAIGLHALVGARARIAAATAVAARRDSVILGGFRARTLAAIPGRLPWIVQLGHGREGHFVAVDSMASQRVFVRDPAIGRIEFPAASFERFWSGYALVILATPGQSGVPR
jgi:hypothetical protein